uniref:CSON000703 protein n=1 Tax=Culicoides sonorensis TaxID=179676 RepID=A0A336KYQ5_CULSO
MSDEEEWMSEESDDGDFSASEDEWLPESTTDKKGSKLKHEFTVDSSDVSEESEIESDLEDDHESDSGTPVKLTRKQAAKRGQAKPRTITTPQGNRKLFSKYKPAPLTAASSSSGSTSLNDILKKAEFRSKKLNSSQNESPESSTTSEIKNNSIKKSPPKKPQDDSDESSSSGDEYLVPADQIDLNSDFFNVPTTSKKEKENVPAFDCNAGIAKSDESDSQEDFNGFNDDSISRDSSEIKSSKQKKIVSKINKKSSKTVDLQELSKYNQELENAKIQLKGFESKSFAQDDVNVSQLLAMGEETLPQPKSSQKSGKSGGTKRKNRDSDSDWEDVEDTANENIDTSSHITKDLQINVELPGEMRKRTNKEVDIEAQIKRKLNNIKKINQVYMHKTHLLCWIAYGNRINSALNNPSLYKAALKTLPTPSKQCYPKDKTDIKYFEQISTWYRQQYTLMSQSVYPILIKLPPLVASLGLQIQKKQVMCKRDYCLAFIVLLRAMGFQCRLVMSLVSVPLKPAQSELCSLSKIDKSKMYKNYKKPEENGGENEKTTLDELKKGRKKPEIKEDPAPVTKRSKRKASSEDNEKKSKKIKKIDQLDGAGDTMPIKANTRSTRQRAGSSKENAPLKTGPDSPFKKSKGHTSNSSSSPVSMPKPKMKRVLGVKLLNDSIEISPLKTRMQRQKEGSIPKIAVTKTSSTSPGGPSNDNKKAIKPQLSPSILKTTRSSSSIKSNPSPKSVTFESPMADSFRVKKCGGLRGLRNKKQKNLIPNDKELFEQKIDQLDGAGDTMPKKANTRSTRQRAGSSKENAPSQPGTDSPFKRNKGNTSNLSSSPVVKLDNFASIPKPKIKRLSEVPLLNDSVEPSPLKTRKQRQKEGSIPKVAQVVKVTKNLSGSLSDSINDKKSTSIVKASPSSSSPKPGTSKDPSPRTKRGGPRGHQNKKQKIVIPESDDEDLFEPEITLPKMKKPIHKRHEQLKKIDRRVLSTDDETGGISKVDKKNRVNLWIEVYAEKEKRWITIDLFKGKVDCVDDICRTATSPITYVVAWNNDNSIKDVSPRYCEHWNTTTRKLRVEKEWWDEALRPFLGKPNERDKAENKYFDKIHSAKPMPTAISDFKNHPLYALERHLLKYEALYPPDVPPIGWIRNEPVYPRDCVYTLQAREKWYKEARVIKLNEKPYKIVKSLKWDKFTRTILRDVPQEIFGIWQTEDYEPPTAENGLVPRNAYGNVEIFKECMLPKKTVHLKLPGLNKVCKKLGIDCAPAVIGFDFSGGSYPIYDGFVVCEEIEETVTEAWHEEQQEIERKEREKIEKRVYGNWRNFKNHPLYALERHLLKFEAIYPPDAPPIGWIRKEPVYPRDCVYTLHTRDKWYKEARVVKLNEEPYKIVTARPKWDRHTQTCIKDRPLEIFGIWQTEAYEPPTAENGIVPRNAYGNVELFKACMLPKKTVHLQLPGLNKVCKKLQIDCAPAVVGFDFHSGSSHPVYDGFVVCEEFEETVTEAWYEDQQEQERKDREKIEKRVYGNWRKLIKGLWIRERLQARYNFNEEGDEEIQGSDESLNEDSNKKIEKTEKKGKGKRKN